MFQSSTKESLREVLNLEGSFDKECLRFRTNWYLEMRRYWLNVVFSFRKLRNFRTVS